MAYCTTDRAAFLSPFHLRCGVWCVVWAGSAGVVASPIPPTDDATPDAALSHAQQVLFKVRSNVLYKGELDLDPTIRNYPYNALSFQPNDFIAASKS